ncbi:hypothetical protein PoB_005883000 [Plakobranchus ocellatus]|uniref:Uncharacterized protein n=1 Tax=Plakobranchus ocellatus TaxID=259542 RepID=A0AAV4CKX8_9GAST|nr:hypothetical protein PoB_005883000 [Plakobranchus ocellatus]
MVEKRLQVAPELASVPFLAIGWLDGLNIFGVTLDSAGSYYMSQKCDFWNGKFILSQLPAEVFGSESWQYHAEIGVMLCANGSKDQDVIDVSDCARTIG